MSFSLPSCTVTSLLLYVSLVHVIKIFSSLLYVLCIRFYMTETVIVNKVVGSLVGFFLFVLTQKCKFVCVDLYSYCECSDYIEVLVVTKLT